MRTTVHWYELVSSRFDRGWRDRLPGWKHRRIRTEVRCARQRSCPACNDVEGSSQARHTFRLGPGSRSVGTSVREGRGRECVTYSELSPGRTRPLHVLTITPFYPRMANESSG